MVYTVPQHVYETLKRIVNSDVAHILYDLPSYNTFRVRYALRNNSHSLSLCLGECDDTEIWITSDGTIRQIAARPSKPPNVGQTPSTVKPLSERFKPIDPFARSALIRSGICTPLGPSIRALVLMYMHIWAAKHDTYDIVLPALVYDDLHQALLSLEEAVEDDMRSAEKHREVLRTDQELCLESGTRATPLHGIADRETASPTKDFPGSIQGDVTSVSDGEFPATESSELEWEPGPPQDDTVVLSSSFERILPREYQASAEALMARLYRQRVTF
jgi:hypothetical protein